MISFLEEKYIVGLSTRTNNNNEADPKTARIKLILKQFWAEDILQKIPCQKEPGAVYILYTEYEPHYNRSYTCMIGTEASHIHELSMNLKSITIAKGKY